MHQDSRGIGNPSLSNEVAWYAIHIQRCGMAVDSPICIESG